MSKVKIKKIKDKYVGSVVKDKVTGFTGTCIGLSEWLFGCKQYIVIQDGDPDKRVILDIGRIEIIEGREDLKREKIQEVDSSILGKHVKSKLSGIKGTCVAILSKLFTTPGIALEQNVKDWNNGKDCIYWLETDEIEIIDDEQEVKP